MTALMEIEEQELSKIDHESQYEMNPCSENGVFRRYHVMNNPVNRIDPEGTGPVGVINCGRYVDKWMKARKECLDECAKDEDQYYNKYGNGVFDWQANLDCFCQKMGFDSLGYEKCKKTIQKCFTVGGWPFYKR